MQRQAKHSFLSRLTLSFSAILILALSIIFFFANAYIQEKSIGEFENASIQATSILQSEITSMFQTAQHSVAMLYNNDLYCSIPNTLLRADALSYIEKYQLINKLDNFLQSCVISNENLEYVSIMSSDLDSIIANRARMFNAQPITKQIQSFWTQSLDRLKSFGPTILPIYLNNSQETPQYRLPIYSRIKSVGMKEDVGYLMMDFSISGLYRRINSYSSSFSPSRIWILSDQGTVFYDSEYEQIGMPHENWSLIQSRPDSFFRMNDSYVRLLRDERLPLNYLCAYSSEIIDDRAASYRVMILMLVLTLAVSVIVTSSILVKHYHKRLKYLCDTISEIGNGRLKLRARMDGPNDELKMIAHNVNILVEHLEQNIESAYQSGIESQHNLMLRKDAELKLVNAELYALQTQVSPHFLHNALEAIRMRATACGNSDVARMAYILSMLFKYSLKRDFIVSVHEELDMCQLYMELSSIRYSGRFQFSFDVKPELDNCAMLRHTLQPILENALKHGLDMRNNHGVIQTSIDLDGDVLVAQVINNGPGIDRARLDEIRRSLRDETLPESSKIGLRNVHLRIIRLFGHQYGVDIEAPAQGGTLVRIRLPAMTTEEMRKYV